MSIELRGNTIKNPISNRWVTIGGDVYRSLVAKGKVNDADVRAALVKQKEIEVTAGNPLKTDPLDVYIPDELIDIIQNFMDPITKLKMRQVCRDWKRSLDEKLIGDYHKDCYIMNPGLETNERILPLKDLENPKFVRTSYSVNQAGKKDFFGFSMPSLQKQKTKYLASMIVVGDENTVHMKRKALHFTDYDLAKLGYGFNVPNDTSFNKKVAVIIQVLVLERDVDEDKELKTAAMKLMGFKI